MTRRLLFIAVAVFLTCASGWSAPEDDNYTRLARISHIEGNVSYQHDSEVDWSAASINLPLEPGDRIYVGSNGRAEIQFEDGSAFRIAENTDVEVLSLGEDLIQLRILVGLATLNVSGDADFEINTPAAAFNTLREGVYRFDVVENGDTDAIVRKGELEAANNDYSRRIQSGELFHFALKRREPEISQYDRRDEWDEWNDRRNADLRVYGNTRYLPDDVYMGSSELDRYGRWVNVESYGSAWVPYDPDPSWSPYSVGRWCYRPLFGWTWVSYEPWGWLPYHYGSWYHSSLYGWCWLPGPAYSFNFWSPGLVSFYSGPGWISWCPLGPGDYYDVRNYHYRRGVYGHMLADLRRLHSRAPGDHFNRDVHGAFRTVQLDQFRNGSFDHNNLRTTRWGNLERPWTQGSLVRDRLTVQPTSTSFAASPGRPAARPREINRLPAVVRNVPRQGGETREGFTRITNPQIPSVTPRVMRSRTEPGNSDAGFAPNARVIQNPQNSPKGTVGEERNNSRVIRSRGSEGDGNRSNTGRGRETQSPGVRTDQPAPSNQQNPSRYRIERTVPEQRNNPQTAPESRPRSESRQQNNLSEARPGIGRWSESNPGHTYSPPPAMRTNRSYPLQSPGNPERWSGSSQAAPEAPSAPSYSPPSSGNEGRWMRSPQQNSAPRQSAPSFGSGGSRPSPAPSPSFGNSGGRSSQGSGGGRNAPEGRSSGGGDGHRR